MTAFLDQLLTQNAWVVYVVVTLLVFAEDALFFGFVIPGETAAVLGGVAASLGHVNLTAMVCLVVAAAIVGDSVGYQVGHHYGERILLFGPLQRHAGQLEKAKLLLRRRGGSAVFFGRYVAFFRAVMPALAGISHMPYRVFLKYNAIGGLVWGTIFVMLGHFAGDSYAQIERLVGRGLAGFVLAVALVAFVVYKIRTRGQEGALEARIEARLEAGLEDGLGKPAAESDPA